VPGCKSSEVGCLLRYQLGCRERHGVLTPGQDEHRDVAGDTCCRARRDNPTPHFVPGKPAKGFAKAGQFPVEEFPDRVGGPEEWTLAVLAAVGGAALYAVTVAAGAL